MPDPTSSYLVQLTSAVPQENDRVSIFDANSHGGQLSIWLLQDWDRFKWHPAGHGTGSVIGATGIGIQSVLRREEVMMRKEQGLPWLMGGTCSFTGNMQLTFGGGSEAYPIQALLALVEVISCLLSRSECEKHRLAIHLR